MAKTTKKKATTKKKRTRATRQKLVPGRPRTHTFELEELGDVLRTGKTYTEAAAHFGCSVDVIHDRVQTARAHSGNRSWPLPDAREMLESDVVSDEELDRLSRATLKAGMLGIVKKTQVEAASTWLRHREHTKRDEDAAQETEPVDMVELRDHVLKILGKHGQPKLSLVESA